MDHSVKVLLWNITQYNESDRGRLERIGLQCENIL